MKTDKIKIGQILYREFYIKNKPFEIKPYIVTKIGRTYFYCNNSDQPFNIDKLKYIDKNYGQNNIQLYITDQEILDRQEKDKLYIQILDRLRNSVFNLDQMQKNSKNSQSNKLMLSKSLFGDCLELMADISTDSIDMILCDLPYETTNCKWDVIIPFDKLWQQYERIIKPNGAIVLTGMEPFSSLLRVSNLQMYKYDWIWDKVKGTGFLNAKKQPMRNHETVSVFYKKQCTYNPQKTSGHIHKKTFRASHLQTEVYGQMNKDYHYSSTDRYPRSIQVFSTDTQNSSLHPTQKPVALFEYLIKTYTNQGETVLDNCSGSGTTAIACMNTNRNYICMEKDEGYYNSSLERVEKHKLNLPISNQ